MGVKGLILLYSQKECMECSSENIHADVSMKGVKWVNEMSIQK